MNTDTKETLFDNDSFINIVLECMAQMGIDIFAKHVAAHSQKRIPVKTFMYTYLWSINEKEGL